MSLEMASLGIHMSLSVLLLLALIWLWRDYKIDGLRERLFGVREELFDYAADHELLSDPAYRELREIFNSIIRYSHRISFSSLMFLILCAAIFQLKPPPRNRTERFFSLVEKLPRQQQRKLLEFHVNLAFQVTRHIITSSVILAPIALVLGLAFWGIRGIETVFDWASKYFPGIQLLEAQAIEIEGRRP